VEYAITRFKSFCNNPTVAAKNAVEAPTIVIKFKILEAYSNKGDERAIKNTPAVTIVAACINAETGVGPSIASGNQVCNPNCADFPTAPTNKKKQIIEIKSKLKLKKLKNLSAKIGVIANIVA
jgi:hypothetical protein